MNDKLTIFEFFAEIFWDKINILPLKIDKKSLKRISQSGQSYLKKI